MINDRVVRWMLWSGPAFLIALIAATVVSRPFGNLPDPAIVAKRAEERRIPMLLAGWLQSIAAALLLLFSIGLWARLKENEGDPAVLSTAALAGGVATSVLLAGSASAAASVAERAGRPGSTPETAAAGIDLSNMLAGNAAPITLAIATGATTAVAARSGILPRWLALGSGALTAGMLSPLNFVFVVGGFIWVAVVGIILGRGRGATPRA